MGKGTEDASNTDSDRSITGLEGASRQTDSARAHPSGPSAADRDRSAENRQTSANFRGPSRAAGQLDSALGDSIGSSAQSGQAAPEQSNSSSDARGNPGSQLAGREQRSTRDGRRPESHAQPNPGQHRPMYQRPDGTWVSPSPIEVHAPVPESVLRERQETFSRIGLTATDANGNLLDRYSAKIEFVDPDRNPHSPGARERYSDIPIEQGVLSFERPLLIPSRGVMIVTLYPRTEMGQSGPIVSGNVPYDTSRAPMTFRAQFESDTYQHTTTTTHHNAVHQIGGSGGGEGTRGGVKWNLGGQYGLTLPHEEQSHATSSSERLPSGGLRIDPWSPNR